MPYIISDKNPVRPKLALEEERMRHRITRKYEGKNELSTIQPVCTCGWEGEKIPAWNDYQMAVVKEQECNHVIDFRDKK